MRLTAQFCLLLLLTLVACGDDGGTVADSGSADSAADSARADAPDGSPLDSGAADSTTADAREDSAASDGSADSSAGDAAGDTGSDAAGDVGVSCAPGAMETCAAPSSCAPEGARVCGSDGRFGDCRYVYSRELCGNGVDDDGDGMVDEGCGCAFGAEFCNGSDDDDCDGTVDEGCHDCAAVTCVRWTIPEDRMCRGASDPTGEGTCVGPLYCRSPDGSATTTPPGGCGVSHCGTLVYGDGRMRSRYCTITGTCVGGVPTASGFTW